MAEFLRVRLIQMAVELDEAAACLASVGEIEGVLLDVSRLPMAEHVSVEVDRVKWSIARLRQVAGEIALAINEYTTE